MPRAAPRVEFLWWSGCPSWERALSRLQGEMADLDLDPTVIEMHEVVTDADAETQSFPGSPTIRIDGADVQPPGDQAQGLTCRIYRRRDGSVSPLPDPADLRDALAAAIDTDLAQTNAKRSKEMTDE